MTSAMAITSYHADPEMVELTKACLSSLKYGRPDYVILVDDHSPLKVKFEAVDKYIYRPRNGGFPKCANTGFKAAYDTGADIIILSNNDVVYTPGWLSGLIKPLKKGYDISSVVMSDQTWETEDKITEGDRFGSLFAMKRGVYEELGGYDESFDKGTFEDLDFHKRAEAAGFRIAKNHAVLVEHQGRATMDKLYPDRQDFNEGREHFRKKYGYVG